MYRHWPDGQAQLVTPDIRRQEDYINISLIIVIETASAGDYCFSFIISDGNASGDKKLLTRTRLYLWTIWIFGFNVSTLIILIGPTSLWWWSDISGWYLEVESWICCNYKYRFFIFCQVVVKSFLSAFTFPFEILKWRIYSLIAAVTVFTFQEWIMNFLIIIFIKHVWCSRLNEDDDN